MSENKEIDAGKGPIRDAGSRASELERLWEDNAILAAASEEAKALFKLFMDEVPDACVLLDDDFRYLYFNRAAEAFSGIKLESVKGKKIFPTGTDERKLERYRDVMRTGKALTLEDAILGGIFGKRRFRAKAFKAPGGLGLVWTDVTETKRTRDELVEALSELNGLATHLIQAREDERKRVAREIHDELGQTLTAIDMELRWIARGRGRDPSEISDRIAGLVELSSGAIETVQRIASELRPGILDNLGLSAAVEWLAEEQYRRHAIKTVADISIDEGKIGEKTATALFRITQEALTNVARHAKATRVHVSLRANESVIELEVNDDGVGISGEQASNPESFGIRGMYERVHELAGSISILGQGGLGTRLSVSVPIPPGCKFP
jgi:signal transduction histidine kinase